MNISLKERNVLVTGGAGGGGAEIVKACSLEQMY